MALDLCIIASFFNIFVLQSFYYDRIEFASHVNSPLGLEMNALLWAYNYSNTPIPGSSVMCSNTYSCSQKLCFLNKDYKSFDSAMIIPLSGTLHTKCSLTVYDCFNYELNNNIAVYLTTVVITVATLIITITVKMYYPSSIFPLLLHIISVITIMINLVLHCVSLSNVEYIVSGFVQYRLIYNILFTVSYVIISLCLIIKIMMLAEKERTNSQCKSNSQKD